MEVERIASEVGNACSEDQWRSSEVQKGSMEVERIASEVGKACSEDQWRSSEVQKSPSEVERTRSKVLKGMFWLLGCNAWIDRVGIL